eukprot:2558293-Rhodomonas_salina.1
MCCPVLCYASATRCPVLCYASATRCPVLCYTCPALRARRAGGEGAAAAAEGEEARVEGSGGAARAGT